MASSGKDITTLSISTGTIIRVIVIGILTYALFYLRDLVLILLTAVVLASAVEPATRFLEKRKIPRLVSVLFIYIIFALIVAFLFYVFVPTLVTEAFSLIGNLPQYIDQLLGTFSFIDVARQNLGSIGVSTNLDTLTKPLSGFLQDINSGFVTVLSSIFGGLFSLVLIIVFSFYLAAQRDGVSNFLRLVTPIEHEAYLVGLWKRSQTKIGYWIQGQLLLAVLIGLLTFLGLSILGIPNALSLSVFAGIMELIPVFGPIISAIPALAVAVSIPGGGASLVLLVAGLYIIIQQFENHLIYPLVVNKIVGIPPLLSILALIIGAQLAGFLGILLSVPIMAVVMELVFDREKQKAIALGAEVK